MANLNTYVCVVLALTTVLATQCNGSAIPMWEYLSSGEKMSHLYSMFAKQVQTYCKSSADNGIAKCKMELLTHGLRKLQEMNESHLDSMDPYQRGANDIIWDSMMEGHPMMENRQKPVQSTPTIMQSEQYPRNPLFDDAPEPAKKPGTPAQPIQYDPYADMEMSYPEPANHLPQEQPTNVAFVYVNPSNSLDYGKQQQLQQQQQTYLSGPMEVRVRLDGTPVDEDKNKPLPKDDDRDEMTIGAGKLPTMQQIRDTVQREGNSRQFVVVPPPSPSHRTYQSIVRIGRAHGH